MNPHDQVRLQHMADGVNAALRFARGRKREDLDTDDMLTFALVHAITVIGEAASKITPETARPTAGTAMVINSRHA